MENTPFYIQPSIELPSERQHSVVWGQPPPLPIQQERYNSTPWSERPQSETTTPLPRAQSLGNSIPRLPSKHLTEDDRLHILQFAIQAGDSWGYCTKKVFWQNAANGFETATGKRHMTLSRAVDDIVKARRAWLAKNDTGGESCATSYTDAVDQWINIIEDRKVLEQARKDAQGLRGGESQESIEWQENGLKRWTDKTQLSSLVRKRKREQASSTESHESNSEAIDSLDYTSIGQSTPVSSSLSRTANSTPQAESVQSRRSRSGRKRRKSTSPDLPTAFRRFVDVFEAWSSAGKTVNSIDKLKVEVRKLKAEIGDLKKDIRSILLLLKEGI